MRQDWTEVKARLERYLAGGIDIWEDDIRAALERVEDYDAIRKERDYYAIEFSALTSNVPPGAKKTLLDTIRSLRQRVEELERAPRCCADTIPPGCRTCRCADAAEANLARVVEAAKSSPLVSYTPVDGEAIRVVPVSVVLAAAKGE